MRIKYQLEEKGAHLQTPKDWRGLCYRYQWPAGEVTQEPAEEGQPVSSSVQKPTLAGDFPDSAGGNKCGRLAKEEVETLSDDDPRIITSKAVACNQVLYGVVTGKMKDADGNEVQVDELPVIGYFKKFKK